VILEHPATPRARRRDAAVVRILDTATTLIATEGLEGLSMARLADAVDYTPGALYRYFDSKDALLSRLVQRTLGDVRAVLDAAVARVPAGAPALARVLALVDGYRAFARTEPHRFGLLALTIAEPRVLLEQPTHAAAVAAAAVAALRPLADALADAATAGELAPGAAAERAICVFALQQGTLQLAKLGRAAPVALDVERLAADGTHALLRGWGASPALLGGLS
jgi:AcrR family transcriptional regulator